MNRTTLAQEQDTLRQLVHRHALRQAEEARCTPADGKVLGYMAENVEWDYNKRYDVPRQHILIAQTKLAENLGMGERQVRRSFKNLIEAGLITDTQHGTRHRRHLYMVTINWSFSTVLAKKFGPEVKPVRRVPRDLPKGLIDLNAPRKPKGKVPRGTARVNMRYNHFCTVCGTQLAYRAGWAIMFDQWTTFCDAHHQKAIERARAGWTQDGPPITVPTDGVARDLDAFVKALDAQLEAQRRGGRPSRQAAP